MTSRSKTFPEVPTEKMRLAAGCAVWLAVLAVCTAIRPLQLDEVLQLIGTRTPHLGSVFDWLRYNPGSVPGGYVVQWALVRTAGFSNLIARLPSLTAWVLTVLALVRIADRAGMRRPACAAVLAAVTPMFFRYAIEGRPYLPALCLTAFATLLLIEFIDSPASATAARLSLYGLLLAAAPLVQGTAATVTVGHALFVIADPSMRSDRARQLLVAGATVLSALPPILWSIHMRQAWAVAIVHEHDKFAFSLHAAFGFLKDITGGGLAGTVLLALAAGYGYARASLRPAVKRLLAITIVAAIGGAFAADALAGYFTSPRQAIYCLSGLIVLAAAGWEDLRLTRRWPAALALLLFIGVSLAKDVSVVRSKEDWNAASRMVARAIGEGFCIQPASTLTAPLNLYWFFEPSIEAHVCTGSEKAVGLVYSSFTPRADRDAAASELTAKGLAPHGGETSGGSTLERFVATRVPADHL